MSSKPQLNVARAYKPGDTSVEPAEEQSGFAASNQIGPFTTWRTMWQPRPLTIPALVVTFCCLLIINTAGHPFRMISPDIDGNHFGWPFIYLRSSWTAEQHAACPPWDRVTYTPPPAPRELPVDFLTHKEFRPTELWQNVFVAMLIAAGAAVYAEVAQRVVFRQARFGLRQLFGAVVFIAVVLFASRSRRVFEVYCHHQIVINILLTIALYLGAIGASCIVVAHVFIVAARNWLSVASLHPTNTKSDVPKSRSSN